MFSEEAKVRTTSERPPAPGRPKIMGTTHNTVSLEWTPAGSADFIKQYMVYFRDCSTACGHSNGWLVCHTSCNATKVEVCIPKLNSNVANEFWVAADYGIQRSNFSIVSEACTTRPASSPLNVQKKEISKNSITIVWDPPKFVCKGASVTKYNVKYQSFPHASAKRRSVEETKGEHCIHVIKNLERNLSYIISVSAVCGEAGKSVFSEPVEIKCKPRTAVDVANHLNPTQNKVSLEGNVSILQLPLAKSKRVARNYRSYYFGEDKGQFNRHIVLMLIGTTAAGKSTLINALINFILDVKWDDNFRFRIIADEGENLAHGQNTSQTHIISSYTINPPRGSNLDYKLTVIDTPGFDDSHSFKHDTNIIQQIRNVLSGKVRHHVGHINAIGFVLKASQTYIPLHQRYFFKSNFSPDLSGLNVMVLVTFDDGQKPPALAAIKDMNIPETQNVFKFNNFALFAKNNCTEEMPINEMFWNMNMHNMKKIINALNRANIQKLSLVSQTRHSAPRTPSVEYKTHNSVRLNWEKGDVDTSDIEHYILHYRGNLDSDKTWNRLTTIGNKLKVKITNLKPSTTFQFAVSAVYRDGAEIFSEMSDACKTFAVSAPSIITVNYSSKTSIAFTWDPPYFMGHGYKISNYIIKYQPATNTYRAKILYQESDGPICRHEITGLDDNTIYTISVSAVCQNTEKSAFSDEVTTSTMMRTANDFDYKIKQFQYRLSSETYTKYFDEDTISTLNAVEYNIQRRHIVSEVLLTEVSSTLGYVLSSETRTNCRTYHFGEMKSAQKQHLVMLVGATGAWKSTLINCMVNYFLDVKSWEDDDRFKILSDDGKYQWVGRDESLTQVISSYTFNGPKDDNIVTIIDIPEFGNTRCIKHDKIIMDIFKKAICNNFDDIYVIGFVAQASQARFLNTISEICF